ncbi:MAG: hypothetical protein SOR38_06860 [Oscillospiraceae bacterium]|nr:hypothetical protein [Oscillospiraceae bacterium]MDY3065514.1 hypothetical protein [Oscillospiraceae bacterium]
MLPELPAVREVLSATVLADARASESTSAVKRRFLIKRTKTTRLFVTEICEFPLFYPKILKLFY